MVYFLIPETIANSLLFAILELSNSWGVCNFGWAIFPHFQFWRSHILPFAILEEQLFAICNFEERLFPIFNFGWAIFCHFEEQLLSCLWKLICAALSCPPCYNYCALCAPAKFSFRPVLCLATIANLTILISHPFFNFPIAILIFYLASCQSHHFFVGHLSFWPFSCRKQQSNKFVQPSLSSAQSLHF